MSVLGHKLRLSRIIDPATSTSVIMPMDHAIEEPDFTELEKPSELIRSFARVVDYALAPVIVAGGEKTNNMREVFEMAHGAKAAGAVGIAMGRKVWQSPDPLSTLAGLKRIIREDATVEQAMECVEAGASA